MDREEQNLKSKFPIGNGIILIIGFLGFSAAGYYLTSNALSDEYPQIAGLILGVFFFAFVLISLVAILSLNIYRIIDDKLQILSIFGFIKSVVYLDQILSWNEVEKENQHMKWKDLTLHLQSRNVKISSSSLKNYHQFKKVLVKGKQRNEYAEIAWLKRNALQFAVGFMILGGLFYYWSFHVYQNKSETYGTDEMEWVNSRIMNEVKIHKGSKNRRSIKLKIADYPDFTFNLDGVAYSVTNKESFLEDLVEGDYVQILITKDQFHKKLTKEWKLDFWDKSVNYRFISIYGLRGNGKDYLTLTDFNQANQADGKLGFWLILAFATFIFGAGIYFLNERRKYRTKDANRR